MIPLFNYAAAVVKIVDGDTIDFDVDLGFHIRVAIRTRLIGMNAPELSTPEGQAAKAFAQSQLAVGAVAAISTHKDPGDKYGRWLAVVHLGVGSTLNELMVSSGHAVRVPW